MGLYYGCTQTPNTRRGLPKLGCIMAPSKTPTRGEITKTGLYYSPTQTPNTR